jgi:hypothetical protein
MSGSKCKIFLFIVLIPLFSSQSFSQQVSYRDSIPGYTPKATFKPELHNSIGNTFLFVPRLGTLSGITFSSSLSIPISPKWSVDGGIIAGRFYSTLSDYNRESAINGAFNELSLFGSASYHINSHLTLYGMAIKQLTGTSPFNFLPKSSYAVGSTYKLGNSSIGVSVQISKWNNTLSPLPFNDSPGFYSPFEQRPAY